MSKCVEHLSWGQSGRELVYTQVIHLLKGVT